MFDLDPATRLRVVNEARIWVTLLTTLAGAGTLVLTWAQVRLQSAVSMEKEAAASEAARRSNERIAQAEAEGAKAQADAAQASVRVVEMQLALRQARLEQDRLKLEVEAAHQETLRLQTALASRRLSPLQQQLLCEGLRPLAAHLPRLQILSAGEAEPVAFRRDIAAIFEASGIKVEAGVNTINPPQYGVVVYDAANGAGEVLARALRQAGIAADLVPANLDTPAIRVGLKPPAF